MRRHVFGVPTPGKIYNKRNIRLIPSPIKKYRKHARLP